MNGDPAQLVLDLPHRSALGAEDFLVSPANQAAVEAVDAWPAWTHFALVIVGPEGAGKSHLGQVWQARSGADRIEAATIDRDGIIAREAARHALVEDIDRGLASETGLFHLLNQAREHRTSVLLTSRRAPGDLVVTLPDLRSRLRALPVVELGAPDDTLLMGVLVKLFADRQLVVEPHVIAYLARHSERSLSAAQALVAEIDRRSLAARRRVTRALVAEVLAGRVDEQES